MADGFGTSPFVLPQMFAPPGQALDNKLDRDFREKQYNSEMDWRRQRQQESDDWRKLQLIQELTDIDKYQTGEAAADALGYEKSQEILQRYTAAAGSMTPAELQYKISQDIGKTTVGMQNMKDELKLSDEKIKQYKKIYPSLNDVELTKIVRADVIGRRINGNEFANPIDANQPSGLNLDDPDFISDFIDVNKGLKDAVVNPKNIQKGVNVLRGSPSSYVGYEADLPFYMKDDFKTEGGFYNKKDEPTMSLKTSTIPKGAFSGAAQDIDVLDEGAFEGLLAESAEVEPALRKLAKTKYKNYSSMSNSEKEIAMRDVAKDFITPYSQNYKYRAKSATKPPSSRTNIYMGGAGGGAGDVKGNEFDRIDYDAGSVKISGGEAKTTNGEPFTGGIRVKAELIPAQVQAILKTAGIDVSDEEFFNMTYKDGKLQSMKPEGSGKVIDRIDMANAQKKWNSEPQKSNQPDFGERVDLTTLDPKGFKKEGNNYRYKDGRLFDAKGNVIKK